MKRIYSIAMAMLVPCVATLAAVAGCDDVQWRADPQLQLSRPATKVMGVHLTTKGMEHFYTHILEHEGGLTLLADAEIMTLGTPPSTLRFGPLEQTLTMSSLEATPHNSSFDLSLSFRDMIVFVPLRIQQGVGTSICRWRVQTTSTSILAKMVVDANHPSVLKPLNDPQILLMNPRVDPVGSCALDLSEGTQTTGSIAQTDLEQALFAYVRRSLASSIQGLLRQNPASTLGLLEGSVALTHISPFEHRHGHMNVFARRNPDTLPKLSSLGLSLSMDYGILAQQPARCAPPVTLSAPNDATLEPINELLLTQHKADVGLTLTTPLLQHTLEALTLSGFLCLGLESTASQDTTTHSTITRDLRLGDLGISTKLLGDRAHVVLSPGSLPIISTQPTHNTLQVRWSNIDLAVYTPVLGTRVRIVSLLMDIIFELRINAATDSTQNALAMNMETIQVERAVLHSEWVPQGTPPDQETIRLWSKRLVLLSLGHIFTLPLPLLPGAPLELVGTQVREHDLALFLRLTIPGEDP